MRGRQSKVVSSQWLLDLAKELPAPAQLDGFDISNKQFPHKNWLPANVTLSELDLLSELPKELIGAYDVVHAGLVVMIARDEPERLLKTFLKMLSE